MIATYRRGDSPSPHFTCEQVEVDLRTGEGLSEPTDYVVHLAAHAGGVQFQAEQQTEVFTENQLMTRTVLDFAARRGVRRVFLASSAVIYRPPTPDLITEDDELVSPHRPGLSGYAWSKVTDEAMGSWTAAVSPTEVVYGRFSNIYGPGGSFDPARSTVVHALVKKAVDAGPGGELGIWGSGDAVRSFLHVRDCARAIITILEAGHSGLAYNVDSSQPISIRDLATLVRDEIDPTLTLRFDASKPTGQARRVCDNSRLRGLGFEPLVGLQDGLAETQEAYRQERGSQDAIGGGNGGW